MENHVEMPGLPQGLPPGLPHPLRGYGKPHGKPDGKPLENFSRSPAHPGSIVFSLRASRGHSQKGKSGIKFLRSAVRCTLECYEPARWRAPDSREAAAALPKAAENRYPAPFSALSSYSRAAEQDRLVGGLQKIAILLGRALIRKPCLPGR